MPSLQEIAQRIRSEGNRLYAEHEALCRKCDKLSEKNGRMFCSLCGCADPVKKDFCPGGKWGTKPRNTLKPLTPILHDTPPPCRFREACGRCALKTPPLTEDECRRCELPPKDVAPLTPASPVLFFFRRDGYRERHCTFFVQPFREAGWRVEFVRMDGDKRALSLLDHIRERGIPDAVVQWDEHSCVNVTSRWMEVIAECYLRGIIPLQIDFGYLGHYQTFMLDVYREDGGSLIRDEWADLPGEVRWEETDPKLQDYRRRVLRGYNEAKAKPSLLEGRYVALYLQQYSVLSRLTPRNHNNVIAARIAEELRKKGLRLAVKTAPSTVEANALTEWPEDVAVFRHEGMPNDTNQRLAMHAQYCMVVSSSITNEFVLNELPVVALGRSWFNGLGIFCEPETWEAIPDAAPEINHEARAKWVNWWIGRQFPSAKAGTPLHSAVERGRAYMNRGKCPGTAITCVYAPDAESEKVVAQSLDATRKALPFWQRIVAVDGARPAFMERLLNSDAQIITISEGDPPRMATLLAKSLRNANGKYVFTIEHDCILSQENADKAIALMDALPNRVVSLGLQSVNEKGEPEYPWSWDWRKGIVFADGFRQVQYQSLSTSIWRAAPLQSLVAMDKLPPLEAADMQISFQLGRLGYIHLLTDQAQVLHYPHTGRRVPTGTARMLAIGCERELYAERGIPFDWNGSDLKPALPFDSASFRSIYVRRDLSDMDDARLALFVSECARLLRPGGRLDLRDKNRLRAIEQTATAAGLSTLRVNESNLIVEKPNGKRADDDLRA